MKPITVDTLYKLCRDEIKKGNKDKVIMISQDDEGNGYHYLWYSFCNVEEAGADWCVNEDIAKEEDTIILG